MATPEQVLQQVRQARGQVKQAAASPNTQGTRGTPGRGGIAARPRVPAAPGLRGGGVGAAVGGGLTPEQRANAKPAPMPTARFPGFKPKSQDGGVSAGSTGGLKSLSGREPNLALDKPMVEPAPAAPPKPAWQQLAERGISGQGSAAANKAKLEELLGPATPGPGGPDQAVSDATDLGVPAPTGPRPLPPGAEPGVGAALSGGLTPEQRAGAKPMPMPTASFPGFKPRGGAGGALSGAVTAYNARPMPGAIPSDGPAPAAPGGLGQTISDPADQMGGGFGDVARTASGLMARRRLPGSTEPAQMER